MQIGISGASGTGTGRAWRQPAAICRLSSVEITMGNVRRENLSDEEFASLKEVGNPLSRKDIPDAHKQRLLELRLVKEELGTLRQTRHGVFITSPAPDSLAGMPRVRRDR
jgi:hypothetical protein